MNEEDKKERERLRAHYAERRAKLEAAMKAWAEENPEAVKAAHDEFVALCEEAPVHAALFGPIGARHGVPKPVGAFVRLYCPELRYIPRELSPVGHDAVAMISKLEIDEPLWSKTAKGERGRIVGKIPVSNKEYWAKFRKDPEENDFTPALGSPWLRLRLSRYHKSMTARFEILRVFMQTTYGLGTHVDCARLGADFRRAVGVSFGGFFDYCRPSELEERPESKEYLTWSRSTDDPPVLSCAPKGYPRTLAGKAAAEALSAPLDPELIARLIPIAASQHPEDMNFEGLSREFNVPVVTLYRAYPYALKEAVRQTVDARREEFHARMFQAYTLRKELEDLASLMAQVSTRLTAVVEQLNRGAF